MGAFRSHHERPSNRRSRSCQRQAEADRDEIIRQATEQGYVDNSNKQEELLTPQEKYARTTHQAQGPFFPRRQTWLGQFPSRQTSTICSSWFSRNLWFWPNFALVR
jgi:hypothetical protein